MICSLLKPDKYSGKRRGACASEISTIGSENQVKTYMDSSNGVRNASSNAYNKVRASAVSLIFLLYEHHSESDAWTITMICILLIINTVKQMEIWTKLTS